MLRKSLLLISILLVACAHQGRPPGGPEDKFAPYVIEETLVPELGATQVPLNTEVNIEFNETVDRRSVEDAFFISPYPNDGYKIKWSGQRFRLEFPGGLDSNRTYVITIGTDTKDLHRNRMSQSFTLAFSTGDSIDRAEISGWIKSNNPVEGTQIWAYSLSDTVEPNPRLAEATYITQCGEDGQYRLPYLALEPYRLFAVADRDLNRLYDPEFDMLGICTKDAIFDSNQFMISECNFQLTTEDTTKPGIYKIYIPDNQHLSLRFDEALAPINTDSLHSVRIQRMQNGNPIDSLPIILIYQSNQDPGRIELLTAPQTAEANYLLTARQFYDLAGNPIEPAYNSIDFVGSTAADTVRPDLVQVIPGDSSLQIALNQKPEFIFSETMQSASLDGHIMIYDTLKNAQFGELLSLKPNHFQFIPDQSWASLMPYTIEIMADSIYDYFGNRLADSTIIYRFQTLNADTLSSISGTIMDKCPADSGRIFMVANQAKKDGKQYEIVVETIGPFEFKAIFPGYYIISGFRDRDGNGKYSYGKISPFTPAERFFNYPDTIFVKSRWPIEGEEIVIPE